MNVMQQINVRDVQATLPASDINRAKRWYSETLGLRPIHEGDKDAVYEIGGGRLYLYESPAAGSKQTTAARFAVDDATNAARQLQAAGFRLERFDIPGAEWEGQRRPPPWGARCRHTWWLVP